MPFTFEIIGNGKLKFSSVQMKGTAVNRFRSSVIFCFKVLWKLFIEFVKWMKNMTFSAQSTYQPDKFKMNGLKCFSNLTQRNSKNCFYAHSNHRLNKLKHLSNRRFCTLRKWQHLSLKLSMFDSNVNEPFWWLSAYGRPVSSILMTRSLEKPESWALIGLRNSLSCSLLIFIWLDFLRVKFALIRLVNGFK